MKLRELEDQCYIIVGLRSEIKGVGMYLVLILRYRNSGYGP